MNNNNNKYGMRMRRRKETKNAISCLLISRSRRHLDLHRSLTWLPNYPSKHESTKGQSKMETDSIRRNSYHSGDKKNLTQLKEGDATCEKELHEVKQPRTRSPT